jgi:hypothetical protein
VAITDPNLCCLYLSRLPGFLSRHLKLAGYHHSENNFLFPISALICTFDASLECLSDMISIAAIHNGVSYTTSTVLPAGLRGCANRYSAGKDCKCC